MVSIRRITLRQFDPLEFFLKFGLAERLPSYVTAGEWTVIAWNPDATLSTSSENAWSRLEAFVPARLDDSDLPFTGGVIGTVSYDAGLPLHGFVPPKSDVPHIHFHRYATAVLWNGRNLFVVGDSTFLRSVQKIHERPSVIPSVSPIHWKPSISRVRYDAAFKHIKRAVVDGDYYQLNLTYPLLAEAAQNPRHLFAHLLRSHSAPSASYIEGEGFSVVSLSPESFISIKNGVIVTSPIKGTRPRGKNEKEDRALSRELLESEKEAAELNMITDLLRNDLGQIAKTGTVRVTGHRLLQKNTTVWHTYSTIEAETDPRFSPLDVLRNMFPGGSVTGCPKEAAMKEIGGLEAIPRGLYTGCSVMLSGNHLESSILIRTIIARGKHLSLGIGGGIVADSNCDAEYEETRRKAVPFLALAHGAKKIFINGTPAAYDDPRTQLLAASNPRAKGVFETMVVHGGKIEHLATHLARLVRSAKIVGMKLPARIMVRDVQSLVSLRRPKRSGGRLEDDSGWTPHHDNSIWRIKLVATPEDVIISFEPLAIDLSHAHGVAATFVSLNRKNPEAKALPYHREWAAHQTAVRKGAAEALLVDRRGQVLEGAYSNVFWVRKGALSTTDAGMLPGITRARVLVLAKRLGLSVHFRAVTRKELCAADEVFLTKSTTGIMPVLRIDRTLIGSGKIGPVTKKLIRKFNT